jgi:hypothetical protein
MLDQPGLNVLLSRCLISLTREYDRTDPTAPPLPFYANLLRVLDGERDDAREVATRARISKRAAKTLLNAAMKKGAGLAARDRAAHALAEAERAWTTRVGRARVTTLRTALEGVVGQLELEHPHYVMQYGTADLSAIGGKWPGHGQDWRPVQRVEPLGALPLTALLSQALMDFTIRYESGRTWSLSSTIHALRKFPDEGLSFGAVPRVQPVGGDGRSNLQRLGVVSIDNGLVKLTALGKLCRDAYEPNVARVEQEWRDSYGDKPVRNLRAALAAVTARLEPGLAGHPLLEWLGAGFREASGEL